jgi:hypothetical protein
MIPQIIGKTEWHVADWNQLARYAKDKIGLNPGKAVG